MFFAIFSHNDEASAGNEVTGLFFLVIKLLVVNDLFDGDGAFMRADGFPFSHIRLYFDAALVGF